MASFDFLLNKSGSSTHDLLSSGSTSPPTSGVPATVSNMPSAPSMQFAGASGLALSASDRALINAVAAMQLRYGKPDEALALLQLCNRLWPDDRQTLRLLTQAFLQVEDYESAEMTEEAFKRHSGLMRPGRADLLRQALVHFGRMRLGEARAALLECVRLVRKGQ